MKIYWLDLETTGLHPHIDNVLELVLCESDSKSPFELGPPLLGGIVLPFASMYRSTLSPFILDMHTKNGLLDECDAVASEGKWIYDEIAKLCDLVPTVQNKDEKPVLAGSCVHFDHEFLKSKFPNLAKKFSHRHYDVSAIRIFCESIGMKPLEKTSEAHRAYPDILKSVSIAKACADWVNSGERSAGC